ncbi:hypothetical protein PENANT_c015G01316 [Penicillium antarcticum]|uniref:Aminoglycoside phosphotransferase domain-containing protein n=1 Tax=Penicillium antarcticum TaxID=416450 RepID=A0A1V6Q398_9EURO|nr:uncharacterized protein N7508_004831 [Penicillium antarcticum]KAJ5305816.1 hypothetical protein N7508_004831 [Penicillium antarcticum]OQD83714.1 hypothetical protein PENANT_c015G01316 [Penicillium antarcticum]
MAPSAERVASIMLSWHSLELVSFTTLQTLWAGYGEISAMYAKASSDDAAKHMDKLCGTENEAAGKTYTLILKLISPPNKSGGKQDEGHLRKMFSYEVEQHFYSHLVPLLGEDIGVARCLASTKGMEDQNGEQELKGLMATIMFNLRQEFPVEGNRRSLLSSAQVHGSLDWLARFHGRTRDLIQSGLDIGRHVLPPLEESVKRQTAAEDIGTGMWLNGGYTYLATRRTEYQSLVEDTDSEWSELLCEPFEGSSLSVAEMAALFLTPSGRPMESYIHGDVKSENLFTNRSGEKVAFFDFQYVGLGLGVCDLAKLFTCSVPLGMLVDDDEYFSKTLSMCDGERRLLEYYHKGLILDGQTDAYDWATFRRHWETALVDWCRFQASWGFWGNTEWLEARVRSIVGDRDWRNWLHQNVSGEQ